MAFDNRVINGSDIVLSVKDKDDAGNALPIACATSHTIEITNAVREVSCKGSGDFTTSEYGRFSWTASTDALLNLGAGATYASYASLVTLMLGKKIISIESFYDEDGNGTDTYKLAGEAIITSINKTAADNENASYSVSLQGRGALVSTLVTA